MSKNRNNTQKVNTEGVEKPVDVIDEAADEEITVEIVDEKEENKVVKVLKKIAPFAIIAGAIAAAFAFGRTSGTDAAYLELLAHNDDEDSEGDEESTDDEAENAED